LNSLKNLKTPSNTIFFSFVKKTLDFVTLFQLEMSKKIEKPIKSGKPEKKTEKAEP
jgi:hypothetical protein